MITDVIHDWLHNLQAALSAHWAASLSGFVGQEWATKVYLLAMGFAEGEDSLPSPLLSWANRVPQPPVIRRTSKLQHPT